MPTNMPTPAKAPMDRPRPAMAGSKGKSAALIGLLGLAVGLVGGYGAGRVSTGTPINPMAAPGSGSYQDGYNAAKKKIDDAHVFPPAPTSATSLSGTIKSVGTGSLVLTVGLSSPNPLADSAGPADRTVTIDGSTKLMKLTPKTPEEFQKDVEAFQKAAAGSAPTLPPSNTKSVPITLQDLKAGDTVTVTADHDILKQASFTATEIDLAQSSLTQGAIAPPPGAPSNAPPLPPPAP